MLTLSEVIKHIHNAMAKCMQYLNKKFAANMNGFYLSYQKNISFDELIGMIKSSDVRKDFDKCFQDRTIKPDGGVIWLFKKKDPLYRRLVLVSEVKKQGTNEDRIKEGKPRQAQGNAIERLGKNLIGIRAAMNHEGHHPFCMFWMGM